jgi:hypothetical protein
MHQFILYLFILIFAVASNLGNSGSAWAMGEFIFDSSSFMRESSQRPNSSSFFIIGPNLEMESKQLESRVDLKVYAFLPDAASTTAEAQNLYLSTHKDLMNGHQITVGRKRIDWSMVDDVWSMGLWQPRFLWDPLRPMQVGLFGAFYQYESANWRVLGFATPVSIPERGTPLYQQSGQIRSYGAWFNPLPEQINLDIGGGPTLLPIQYQLNMPGTQKMVMRPGSALQVRYGGKSRIWSSLTAGVLPVNQTDLSGTFQVIGAGTSSYLNANVSVRFLAHQVAMWELGYRGRVFNFWTSAVAEKPLPISNPDGTIYTPTGPSQLVSFGGDVHSTHFKFSTSYLQVWEQPTSVPNLGTVGAVPINLPERYPYRKAVQFKTFWDPKGPLSTDVSLISDLGKQSNLLMTNLFIRPQGRYADTLLFGLGVDLIQSSTGQGWIGQYRGNDRFRGSVSYVF